MILAVGLASRWEWISQQHLQLASLQTRQALRLAAISQLEQLEITQLQQQVAIEHNQATTLQHQAQTEQGLAERDALYAVRLENRHDYYQRLAGMEDMEAQRLLNQSQRTALWMGALQRNMTVQEQELQAATNNTSTSIHPGWCDNNALFKSVCSALGGSLDLKHNPEWMDAEKIQLQHEAQEVTALQQREYLQELVAQLLQDRAERFHTTAVELQQVAQSWQYQASMEQSAAHLRCSS